MKGEPEVTLKILRPMKEVDFKSITVTRTFYIRTLSLTYIAHIIGPEDTEGEFNGTLKRGMGEDKYFTSTFNHDDSISLITASQLVCGD